VKISTYKVDVLGAAFVRGFFSQQLEEDVNYVNALEVAKARGIKVEQIKISEEEEYSNSIRVKVTSDKEERLLEGTLFANKEVRFAKMDDVYIEIAPSEQMLVINNQDKTRSYWVLGTTLGANNINIAGMSLGKYSNKKEALTILNLDNAADEKVIAEIKANPNIISLKVVKL